MDGHTFSRRHGFAPSPDPMSFDQVPPWVREEAVRVVRDFVNATASATVLTSRASKVSIYDCVRPYIWKVLNKQPPGNPMNGPWAYYIPQVFQDCAWYQFYDILEDISKTIDRNIGPNDALLFAEQLNEVFAHEGLAWRFKEGVIEREFPPQVTEAVQNLRAYFRDPRFGEVSKQFEKARGHLNKRPEPDFENCVKDAVGALEGAARILSNGKNSSLNHVLTSEPFKSAIHQTIRDALLKIEGYRNDAPGAGHGNVPGKQKVETADAEFVLTTCAAGIMLLIEKAKPAS